MSILGVYNPLDITGAVETGNTDLRETSGAAKSDEAVICRAMIMNCSGSVFQIKDNAGTWSDTNGAVHWDNGSNKLYLRQILVDSTDKSWGYDDSSVNHPNKSYTVSLDPNNTKYLGKVLNTDPARFQELGHLLYLDFLVENELAPVKISNNTPNGNANTGDDDAFLSYGSTSVTNSDFDSSEEVRDTFGRFDARYRAPRTTTFISQPYGLVEHDLFHFECLSDGAVANNEFKISIENIRKSANPNYEYGTFDVAVRKFRDSDFAPQVLERFVACNLDPDSPDFIARKIGDKKVIYNFDADLAEERRLVISGRYPNRSLNIRIVMEDGVYKGLVPKTAVPFGFKGIPVLKVNGMMSNSNANASELPPLPMTFKATKGQLKTSYTSGLLGQSGVNERPDARIYWGVKTTRIEDRNVVSNSIFKSNIGGRHNALIDAYTKFQGLSGGSSNIGNIVANSDTYNNNKFTLARVATAELTASDAVDQSLGDLIKETCYIRNGTWDPSTYLMDDAYTTSSKRATFASLIHTSTPSDFNKVSSYAKFTNVFYGGFDGLNILDQDISQMNDNGSSVDGKAQLTTDGLGLLGTKTGDSFNMSGEGKDNNVIASYRQAISIMTDPMTVKTNLLVIPGIKDEYVTNHAANLCRDYSMAMYLMDIPSYDSGPNRIYGTSARPDVENTVNTLESRAIDNNYVASYFPDVYITDPINNRRVLVPASVAALGALAYSDNVSYPWFAPAGFNRGALDFVENTQCRLSVADRDTLYEARVNPIANFPNGGYVIFGQKTMQQTQSALDRVNVRRLLLEVKRQVLQVANVVLFEQNTPQTRERFANLIQPRLAEIQQKAGLERFTVVCDDTNNTSQDVEENRLNGKILLVPTRTIEFIAIDFIVTNSGVSFE